MEQLRLPDIAEAPSDEQPRNAPAKQRSARARRRSADWRLDPDLRLLGRRKVLEARQVLDETRQALLAEAS